MPVGLALLDQMNTLSGTSPPCRDFVIHIPLKSVAQEIPLIHPTNDEMKQLETSQAQSLIRLVGSLGLPG